MKLKICGMKHPENIQAVAALQPDYMGFIFYEKSKRNFDGDLPNLPKTIKKVGVFVDENQNKIIEKIKKYKLQAIQLHGNESADDCKLFRQKLSEFNIQDIEIIKVFSIDFQFDFKVLEAYESVVDYFLFDTMGKEKGGNGVTFNWKLLEKYPSQKPYFLSGGIGLEIIDDLKSFMQNHLSKYCYAIDVNSRFEVAPGVKNIEKLKIFKHYFV